MPKSNPPLPNLLQPVAFTIQPALLNAPLDLQVMPFPLEWLGPLNRLHSARWPERFDKPSTAPVRSLNAVLTALVPYLSTMPRMPVVNTEAEEPVPGGDPWLVASMPIPVDRLWLIVQAWVEQTYPEPQLEPILAEVRQALRAEDLRWAPLAERLGGDPAPNGTARPTKLAYHLLPALLADVLVQRGVRIPVYGQAQALVRVPSEEGAELMTWPPMYQQVESRDGQAEEWGFSYVLNITLRTLVGQTAPRIHVHYSVRRWIGRALLDGNTLYMRRGVNVFLHQTTPWLDLGVPGAFTMAHLAAAYEGDRRVPVWGDHVPAIAQRLEVPFPTARDLVRDPDGWLRGMGGVVAGLTYKTPRNHPIAPGLGFDEHELLTTILTAAWADHLTLRPPLHKLPPAINRPMHPLAKDSLRELPVEQRLASLAQSVGPQVTIEVWWETEATRNMLVDRIRALLEKLEQPFREPEPPEQTPVQAALFVDSAPATDEADEEAAARKPPRERVPDPLAESAPNPVVIDLAGQGRLQIIPRRLGEIGGMLGDGTVPPSSGRELGAWKRKMTEQRVAQVRQLVAEATEPTLALIELPNYQDPRKRQFRRQYGHRDPKKALVRGMAWTGRVSQFTTGDTGDPDSLRTRCENAVKDGLRHLGYLPAPIGYTVQSQYQLPEDLVVAAVWQIRLTTRRAVSRVYLPVVVVLHTQRLQVQAWLPDGGGLRSYREALIDITKLTGSAVTRKKRDPALTALRNFLQWELPREGAANTLILVAAQNARDLWPGINDGEAAVDALRFNYGDAPIPVAELAGAIRVLRLRTSDRGETPEWYVPGVQPGAGFKQGVWPDPGALQPRTFYNSSEKPHTLKTSGMQSKQVDPSARHVLPSLLEIVPLALQPREDPDRWAVAVDQWRRMGFLTPGMTLLPLPLHLASKMNEYAEVIGPWIFPEEWEEDEPDTEEDVEGEGVQLRMDFGG